VPASYRSENGIDLEVTAAQGAGSVGYNETVVPVKAGWLRSRAATGLAEQLSAKSGRPGDLVTGPGAQQPNALAAAAPAQVRTIGGALATSEGDLALSAMEPICSIDKTSNTHDHRAKIGDIMPSVNNMTGRLSYRIGTSHALGIGYKAYNGAVSEGGTITRSSDESVSPTYQAWNRVARTTWRYRDYKNPCTQAIHARPESHQGGYYQSSRSHPSYSYCKYYAPMTWSANSATAWTYQAGVTLWGVLNVNAQTGYDHDVTLSYKFGVGKYLCGNNANPPSAKLVAGR
jgi:hypothetical protein